MEKTESTKMYIFDTAAGKIAVFILTDEDISIAWNKAREWCEKYTPGTGAKLCKGAPVTTGAVFLG